MTSGRGRPSVSVVIPCFNQARYLRDAVQSVQAQDYAGVECVVVDDGSTDETAIVASTLGVRLLQPPHGGVARARNAGLEAVRTDLVAFLDADDELLPDAVTAEVAAFARHPGAAGVVGRCQPIDVDGRVLPSFNHDIDTNNLYREWLPRNFVWTPGAAMFKRSALEEIAGFPADLGPAADYAVYLRLARTNRITFLPRELVRYRQHDANMTRDPALMLRATIGVLRREQRDAPAWAHGPLRDGLDVWRQWYGDQIIEDLRTHWQAGHVGSRQLRAALTLIHHCPKLVLRRAAGKSRRLVGGRIAP
jgi:glycosyltransferase involved in cell wall biosynthesis